MDKKLLFKITTDRLILRNLKVTDVSAAYVAWLNDPQFKKYLTHSPKKITISACRQVVGSYAYCRDKALIGIFLRDSREHIGNITISSVDWWNRFVEAGIGIGREGCQRKGFAFESLRAFMNELFDKFGMHSVQAGVNANNMESLNLFLKCGFKVDGHLRQTNFIGGKFHDAYIVSCLKEDFIRLYPTELRVSNGKIWRPRFKPDARRDDEAVVDALRRGEATPQQAKDRPTKFSLLTRSSVSPAKITIGMNEVKACR